VEQVLGVEVETAPLDGGLRRSLKQVAGRVAEELGDVDLFHPRFRGGHSAARCCRRLREEAREEVVEEA
jgi:hypothetical protein